MSKTLKTVSVRIADFGVCDAEYDNLNQKTQLCTGDGVCFIAERLLDAVKTRVAFVAMMD
jgi:hypothetical protein